MDRDVYRRMQELEATHWWFVGRRKILSEVISRLIRPAKSARILEAGCGSGGNLALLKSFGHVDAFEFDAQARARASDVAAMDIPFGALPDQLPEAPAPYDLICMFDVLEHIEQDTASLKALADRLADGGALFLTVPAFPSLWSHHDNAHHHHRRYTKTSLEAVAAEAGFTVERSFYFNALLFPLAWAVRGLKSLVRSNAPDDALPPPFINTAMTRIFASERRLIGRVPMPFGLSLGAVLRRENAP